jgi:transcriptional regulator with XRE-family HTH domain
MQITSIIREQFAQQLRKARLKKRLSLGEVALALNMTEQNYSRIERAKQSMPYEHLSTLSSLLDISIDELFSFTTTSSTLTKSEELLVRHYQSMPPELQAASERIIRALYLAKPDPNFVEILSNLITSKSGLIK